MLSVDAPDSYLSAMMADWVQWAPGDDRGSKDYATITSLKSALHSATLEVVAQELEEFLSLPEDLGEQGNPVITC